MRARIVVTVLACAAAFSTSVAHADIGPFSCPAGQHDEYHYGHHCVPDGVKTPPVVKPTVSAPPSTTVSTPPSTTVSTPPSTTASAPPSTTSTAIEKTTAVPTPARPDAPKSSGNCGVASISASSAGGAWLLLVALAALARRRRA